MAYTTVTDAGYESGYFYGDVGAADDDLIAYPPDYPTYALPAGDPSLLATRYVGRSPYLPLPFLLPALLTGVSWFFGGTSFLTDAGMVTLTLLCAVCFAVELLRFPQRFGIGGCVLFGGVLVWFCHDYFYYWFNYNSRTTDYPAWVIAKAAFLLSVLVVMMVLGLNVRRGRWMSKLASLVPEAGSGGFYLTALLVMFVIGVLPYFLFTEEPGYVAIWREATAMRGGQRATWVIGRSGNLNRLWGAYVLHMLDVGMFSGMFGAFYATLVARNPLGKVVGWGVWLFWTCIAFGSGTRGQTLGVVAPALGCLYVKYHVEAATLLRRAGFKAYVMTGLLALGLLALVQFQGMFRDERFVERRHWSDVELFRVRGNHMFSEGLLAAKLVPSRQYPFFGNRFPGEGALRVLPETLYYGLLHPIPRVLWPGKPVDPAWEWYNWIFTRERTTAEWRTTIAPGMAVGQYMRYGLAGVIEFGLLFGWLLMCTERVLLTARNRPIQILTALALAVWLFRCFRGGFAWQEFYSLVIGLVAMSVLVFFARPLMSRR